MDVSAKEEVRARLRALRRERVPGRDRARDAESLAVGALVVAHDAGVVRGSWVAAYDALPSEPPTDALVAALVARGIRVMLPVTLPDWDLDWHEAGTDPTDPAALLGPEAVGWARSVLLPAHAVDRSGTRLGRGKGCYDRVLPRTTARRVAVVHPWEVLDQPLPREPHDVPVHAALTAEHGVVPLVGVTGDADHRAR